MILSPHETAWLAIHVAKWTGDDVKIAVAVACGESGNDAEALARSSSTSAYQGQRDHGLWQISGKWHGAKLQRYRWRDPFDNARMARAVFDEFVRMGRVGWEAWAVYNSGSYTPFLLDAEYAVAAPFEPINTATTAWRRT
jgi:hypothetical protein